MTKMNKSDNTIIARSPVGELIILLDGEPNQYNCISYKELQLMTKNNCPHIVTPLTTAIDTFYTYRGYRVIVKSEDKEYCLNDMLLGDTKPNEKELRTAHNAEKLFLSGCYDIKVNWDI